MGTCLKTKVAECKSNEYRLWLVWLHSMACYVYWGYISQLERWYKALQWSGSSFYKDTLGLWVFTAYILFRDLVIIFFFSTYKIWLMISTLTSSCSKNCIYKAQVLHHLSLQVCKHWANSFHSTDPGPSRPYRNSCLKVKVQSWCLILLFIWCLLYM